MHNFYESYQTTLSPNSRLSSKKRLKSRQRTKCSFLVDEVGIQKLVGIAGKILGSTQADFGSSISGRTFD